MRHDLTIPSVHPLALLAREICQEPTFWAYLSVSQGCTNPKKVETCDEAAEMLCQWCLVAGFDEFSTGAGVAAMEATHQGYLRYLDFWKIGRTMGDRQVARGIPHLILGPRGWVCCMAFTKIGRGFCKESAYLNWQRVNAA